MFQNFTQKSFDVIMQAQESARSSGDNVVGTEQLLLGLLATENNEASKALSSLGIRLDEAKEEIEKMKGPSSEKVLEAEIPFTPQAKQVLEFSIEAASKLSDKRIDPRHLLIGIMMAGDSTAAVVIQKLANSSGDMLQTLYYTFDTIKESGE